MTNKKTFIEVDTECRMKFQDSDSEEEGDAGDVDENWRLQRLEREKWVKGIFSLFINGVSRVKEDGSLAGGWGVGGG